MKAEKKLRKLTEHLEGCINAWTRHCEMLEKSRHEDENDAGLFNTMMHDRAVFQGILDLLARYDKEEPTE